MKKDNKECLECLKIPPNLPFKREKIPLFEKEGLGEI
jgi:hypothetical protein